MRLSWFDWQIAIISARMYTTNDFCALRANMLVHNNL